MGVLFIDEKKLFRLSTENSDYIFRIRDNGELEHLYYGAKLNELNIEHSVKINIFASFLFPHPDSDNPLYSHNAILREYPSFGRTDFRNPAFSVRNKNGDNVTDIKYESHAIYPGKNKPQGMPGLFSNTQDDCMTLEVVLYDQVIGLEVKLLYSVFHERDVIVRAAVFHNRSDHNMTIEKAMSFSVDFEQSDFEIIHLPGTAIQERDVVRERLNKGTKIISSRKGSSSHGENPFFALCYPDTDENHGEVYGVNFVYSGDFEASAEIDEQYRTRISMGINPETFSWALLPKDSFHTPECVLTFSNIGLNQMSQNLHALYINNLFLRKNDKPRPVAFNHWEATIFNFNEEILMKMADAAEDLGIELFVVDDGWFGKRNDDTKSLGDWYVNTDKFPNGLDGLIEYVQKKGMELGLWVEPEMVSQDSELFRTHPDWCLHVEGRSCSMSRNQMVLDMANGAVCDYLIKALSDILTRYKVSYIKWDMNRYHTEVGSPSLPADRQNEVSHRFILGVYRVMEELTGRFPNVLFEGCASGGGRFDPGILHYMPQIWTSDNTDPIARLNIKYGTSYAYPPVTMSSHIAAKVNLFSGRETSYKTKYNVAMSGALGVEFDITKLSEAEKTEIRGYISHYKKHRRTLQDGRFFRLIDPNSENRAAWMTISQDGTEIVVMYCRKLKQFASPHNKLKLSGLRADAEYRILHPEQIYQKEGSDMFSMAYNHMMSAYVKNPVISGSQLMSSGLIIPDFFGDGDFQTSVWILERIEK